MKGEKPTILVVDNKSKVNGKEKFVHIEELLDLVERNKWVMGKTQRQWLKELLE